MKILDDLSTSYAQIRPDGSSQVHDAKEFWQDVAKGRVEDSGFGHLIAMFTFTEDWPTWEMHPAGDEFIYVVEGALDLILRLPEGDSAYQLSSGQSCLVPKDVWHTAKVSAPCRTLHVTPGDGTENRENPD